MKVIRQDICLDPHKASNIKTIVHEDNQGCTVLANVEPLRITPRSEHYAIKYHWSGSELKPNSISIFPV